MQFSELMAALSTYAIRLQLEDDDLIILGDDDELDDALWDNLIKHKPALLDLVAQNGGDWLSPAFRITPDMLPLVQLDQATIDRIVASVPGGVTNVQDIYPLAPLQEGMLYHHVSAQQGDPYVLQAQFTFDSHERLQAFAEALQCVIDRHDILRTSVVWERLDQPLQVIWREARLVCEQIPVEPVAGDVLAALRARFDARDYRLDVRQAPMLRLAFAPDPANQRIAAILLFHHMALDHTALDVVRREIQAHLLGQAGELGQPVAFRNYVAQARSGLDEQAHEAFFRDMLGDIDEPTLPFGLQEVQGADRDIDDARIAIDSNLSQRLRGQARQLGVSAASLMHLALAQVLGKVSGRTAVVFGTVLLGRMDAGEGADRALGMFINTLPLRVDVGEQSVRDGVKATHARLTALLGHEHASLALAQRCSGVTAPTPLFSAILNYRHSDAGDDAEVVTVAEGIQVLGAEERTNYPLTVNVDDLGEDFSITVLVDSSIGARRIGAYLHTALESLVLALEQTPDAPLQGLTILPAAEREYLLETLNTTQEQFADNALIHHQVQAHAAARPDATAVLYQGQTLTYGELNERANQVAHRLLALGIRPDDRVAICVERGLPMIVGLLGILKAGAGYVPIDPAHPRARIAYTLQDSAPVSVLVQADTQELVNEVSVPVIDLDDRALQTQDTGNPQVPGLNASHLAYVIYTSGSTGLPKGVMIEHRNVARLFTATQSWFGFNHQDVWALFHSFAFDFSVWEIWGALIHGGQLVVVPQLVSRSPAEFYALLCESRVSILNQTPSAFRQLIAVQGQSDLKHSLRQVIFGGEALEPGILKPWYGRAINAGTQLVNMYGITETTVHVTYRALHAADAGLVGVSPIGGRIPDLQLYVLDAHREPVPAGVIGELYVGGAGVARGYLNRDELTAERFIADPFSGRSNARLYKTGDLGRWLADGSVEYLGRNDDQVKIRGFRIELGEIEARLAACDGVREAVVIAREGAPGDKRLVAYVIASQAVELNAARLRDQLRVSLADYMVPSAFVMLDVFPLTTNGKLDSKALPAPDTDAVARRGYEAPQGEAETLIAALWQDLLQVERVGRHDNFFELGGHSLLAVKLIERMRQIELSADVRVLFGQPTLAALAAAAGGQAEVVVPASRITPGCTRITPDLLPLATLDQQAIDRVVATVPGGVGNVQDIYGLAPLQAGILYHHLTATEGDPYVLQVQFGLEGPSQVQAFCGALQSVVERHDILRTSVVWEGLDEPVQVVWRHAPLAVEQIEIDGQTGDVLQQLHERFDPRHYRLDFTQAPLLRFVYSQDLPNNRWVGILLLHHLVLDHTALAVLVHEMSASLTVSGQSWAAAVPYRNYVAQARSGVDREAHELFFREMLGDIDEPTLAFGLQDVQGDGRGIEEAHLVLETPLCLRLRQQARHLGVSVASLMHLAWAQVLGQVSGRDEVVFGTVLLGRMQGGEGADRALGMFINTLPLRVSVGAMGAQEGVRATHSRLSRVLGHEHASLSLAQRCSGVPASLPLFSTLLNYRHSAADTATDGTLGWEGIQILNSQERSNYPLVLNVDDRGQGFELIVQALAEVDGERVGQYMQTALLHLVTALEQAPETPLHGVSILSVEERDSLLQGFNLTARPYPHEHTVQSLFEAQAVARPEASAVVHNGVTVSYAELNIRANRLAHHLLGLGVKPGDSVATLLGRSVDLLVSQLAIYKCAAVYVPLDINAPAERQHYMVQDSGAVVVLTLSTDAVSDITRCVEVDTLALAHQPVHNPLLAQSSEAVAYVMYTSGSTGAPKGVLVPHRAITRLVINNGYAEFNEHDRVAFASNPAFDASTLDVWAPLLNGGCVVVVEQEVLLSRDALRSLLQAQSVSVLWMTAGLFHQYADGFMTLFTRLRYLIVGGDVLDPAVIARVLQEGAPQHLLNGYGPTEATTFSTTFDITSVGEGSIPIGRPIGNSRAYVLDARQQPVPAGVTGELYIGGAGVAKGYLNQPGLTAEKFLDDPFLVAPFVADPLSDQPQARMYRTGDLACWRADGTLQYQGRNDNQVKIRGFRIEPGEIEVRLASYPRVKDAVVLVREDEPGDKRLVAYYTRHPESDALGVELLRGWLQEQLPDYMVPSAYVHLDSLPLTANGKLDRKALPAPDHGALLSRGFEAPQGDVEVVLAQIWADLLKIERVGRHDHFFELGGHSLLAVSLIERMRQIGLSADVRALFSQPTLAALAAAVGSGREVQVPANLIPADCQRITPELLTLVALDQDAIDRIVASVPGGAANVQDIYPLAPLQEGILYHHITAEQGDPYLLQSQLAFDSLERLQAFAQALQKVSERHDILRTSVVWEGLQNPVQVVWRKAPLAVQEILLNPADGDVLKQLHARFDARQFRLELTRAPLIQLVYAQDPAGQRVVAILLFHHIALDHTALDVVRHEMQSSLQGDLNELDDAIPYRNYVAQARLGVSEQEQEAFFREMLGDIDEPTLPFGLQDVQGDGSNIEETTQPLPVDLNDRLRAQARLAGVSAASLFHLAWAQVLAATSGKSNVVFGTVLLGRLQGGAGADRALGMFINTLPLRLDIDDTDVHAGVKSAHGRLTALLGHEHASLALAQRCSGVAAPLPLFSAMLNYRHSDSEALQQQTRQAWQGIETLASEERTNYPLTLNVDDTGEGFNLTAMTPSQIGAQRICGYMQTALASLVEALEHTPRIALNCLPVLTVQEREHLLFDLNATDVDYDLEQTLHGLFEAQVKRSPEALAVLAGVQRLTYTELNRRANQLAHYLRLQGVGPDSRVAICVERGLEMVVGLVAILKAGGGYVPVDPAYPQERIAYMLQDSAPVVVLAQGATRQLLGEVAAPVIDLGINLWHDQPDSDQQVDGLTAQHLAYVIYTSGSTGQPKGVINEHGAVVNRLLWMQDEYGLTPSDAVLQKTPFSFDVSVWEFFWPLFTGARLVMARPEGHKDPIYLSEIIRSEHITTLHFVPSVLDVFLAHGDASQCSGLKRVLCSGEALPGSLVRRFKAQLPASELHNLYGPTEAAVDVTAWNCAGTLEQTPDNTPIGKPIANTRMYLLDAQMQPVPQGVIGELYIGGVQVARGYLHRPELTAERFLTDPFSDKPHARMYRTGDVARYRADGNIEYLGRNDDQVKIRGLRIELGEIQSRLTQFPEINEAVVLAREDVPGDKRLVAYYTASTGQLHIETLRSQLLEHLPDYMVPSVFVHLDALPLSPNGKLDRKALPAPGLESVIVRHYEAPVGETEITLARLWAELLNVERVGRHDHFFELGGHSLLAVSLIGRMHQEGMEADVRALFEHPTLSDYAAFMERMEIVL